MDKHIVKFEFPGGNCSLDVVGGNLHAGVSYDHADFAGSVNLMIKSKAGLDHLKALIPGTIDDAIINLAKAALGV